MIRETLKNLPEGLGVTYKRILTKISRISSRAQLAQKVFKWATIAKRPLHIEELKEAVAIEPDDKAWDEDKFPHADLMFESCRGLVIKDPEDETVYFAHHTIRQYLTGGLTTKVDPLFEVSVTEADHLAGQVCVAYLSFSDFETQIASNIPLATLENKGVLASGGPLWIPSMLGIRKSMFDIPYRLLRGDPAVRPLDSNHWKHLIPKPKSRYSPSTDLKDKYRLLCYAIEYWEPHARSYKLSGEPIIARRLENLAMDKTLAFDFRPWGSNQHFGPYGCVGCPSPNPESLVAKDLPYMSMIHYAAEVGNLALFTSRFSTKNHLPDYIHHERYNQETLLIACRHNKAKIVEYLWAHTHYLYDISDGRAVNVAAAAGQVDVLQYLIGLGQYPVKQNGDIPLLLAARNGHDAAVEALFDAGADLNDYDEQTRRNIIESAAMNGHDHILWILNRRGAQPLLAETTETTALHLAATHGHAAATRALLELGAPVGMVNSSELTALHLAAEAGHNTVVEVLLEYGADPTSSPSRIEYIDDNRDGTPYHLAAKGGHVNVLESFNKIYKIAETPRNSAGRTLLHSAAARNQGEAMRWLVKNGADVNAADVNGRTPLLFAAGLGNETAVRVLLELGGCIDYEAMVDNIFVYVAANIRNIPILRMLLQQIREDQQAPYAIKRRVLDRYLAQARSRGSLTAAEMLEQELALYETAV